MQLRDIISSKSRHAALEMRQLLPFTRSMPDFIVIGAQKSGTSSMFTYLKQHPQILRPLIKEPYFFDRHYHRGLSWYGSNFPARATIERLNQKTGKQHYTFEATATYVFNPQVPERISKDLSTRRFITLLRNPVDRAVSAYWHARRQGIEMRSLEEAIDVDLARYEAEKDFSEGRTTAPLGPPPRPTYLKRGVYHEAISSWIRFFSKNEMLVIQSEVMFSEPAKVMRQVFDFLNLPQASDIDYEPQNVGTYKKIEPKTKDFLERFYSPHNDELYRVTGTPFSW